MDRQDPSVEQQAGTRSVPHTTSRGRRLFIVRAGWVIVVVMAVILFLVSVPTAYIQYYNECGNPGCGLYAAYNVALEVVYALGFCGVGAFIFWKRSNDYMALFTSLALVVFGTNNTLIYLADSYPELRIPVAFVSYLGSTCFLVLFYLFPDGRFVPRWTRVLAGIWIVYQVPFHFFPQSPFSGKTWPPLLYAVSVLIILGALVFAQVYRYVRVSGPVERQQIKWVVFGLTTTILLSVGTALASLTLSQARSGGVGLSPLATSNALYWAGTLPTVLVPLSIAIAILRYHLWDIDIIVNRTIVYATLSVSVVLLYALLVSGLGRLLPFKDDVLTSLIAAGLIAFLFTPLRIRLQRGVNHLMYGERDDPYKVISRLGQRLETTLAPGAVLATIVETVAQALKLPYAAISLKREDELVTAAEYGSPVGEHVTLPLVYQGSEMGKLVLAPRAPGESFSSSDQHLLEGLARQAGVAVHAMRLTADLQRSRERLVIAREEERRRLRRDLHDGLGPQLAGLALKHEAVRNLMRRDPVAADTLLAGLKNQLQAAVEDGRRLVDELRPPQLDQGVALAIREQVAGYNLPTGEEQAGDAEGPAFSHDIPEKMPQIPAAIEVAAYRIVQEATTNVMRHAQARHCHIRLSISDVDNHLEVEIIDDGRGLPDNLPGRGVGLVSMRERAAELGGTCVIEPAPTGGTRVFARLPMPPPKE